MKTIKMLAMLGLLVGGAFAVSACDDSDSLSSTFSITNN